MPNPMASVSIIKQTQLKLLASINPELLVFLFIFGSCNILITSMLRFILCK